MNRIEEANKNIDDLIRIIQEQENEIEQHKLQTLKLTKIFKLLLDGRFDFIKLSSDFDVCDNENAVENLYQQYIEKCKNTKCVIESKLVTFDLDTCRKLIDNFKNNGYVSDEMIQENGGIYWTILMKNFNTES